MKKIALTKIRPCIREQFRRAKPTEVIFTNLVKKNKDTCKDCTEGFLSVCFGVTSSNTQGSLLTLHSKITPGNYSWWWLKGS